MSVPRQRKSARLGALAGIAVGIVAATLRYAGNFAAPSGGMPRPPGLVIAHGFGFMMPFVMVGSWIGYAAGRLRRTRE